MNVSLFSLINQEFHLIQEKCTRYSHYIRKKVESIASEIFKFLINCYEKGYNYFKVRTFSHSPLLLPNLDIRGVELEKAEIIFLGNKHSDEEVLPWYGKVIDTYARKGDILFIEMPSTWKIDPNELNEFVKKRYSISQEVKVLGWDDEKAVKEGSDLAKERSSMTKKIDEMFKEVMIELTGEFDCEKRKESMEILDELIENQKKKEGKNSERIENFLDEMRTIDGRLEELRKQEAITVAQRNRTMIQEVNRAYDQFIRNAKHKKKRIFLIAGSRHLTDVEPQKDILNFFTDIPCTLLIPQSQTTLEQDLRYMYKYSQ